MSRSKSFEIEELIGVVPTEIIKDYEGNLLSIFCDEGVYNFIYHQDCCASCWLADVDGDLGDLVGYPIAVAEIVSSDDYDKDPEGKEPSDSYTWVFYKLGNSKTSITLRFYGESNGYYSETVSLEKEITGNKEV